MSNINPKQSQKLLIANHGDTIDAEITSSEHSSSQVCNEFRISHKKDDEEKIQADDLHGNELLKKSEEVDTKDSEQKDADEEIEVCNRLCEGNPEATNITSSEQKDIEKEREGCTSLCEGNPEATNITGSRRKDIEKEREGRTSLCEGNPEGNIMGPEQKDADEEIEVRTSLRENHPDPTTDYATPLLVEIAMAKINAARDDTDISFPVTACSSFKDKESDHISSPVEPITKDNNMNKEDSYKAESNKKTKEPQVALMFIMKDRPIRVDVENGFFVKTEPIKKKRKAGKSGLLLAEAIQMDIYKAKCGFTTPRPLAWAVAMESLIDRESQTTCRWQYRVENEIFT